MRQNIFLLITLALNITFCFSAKSNFESDIIKTSEGDLEITFIGHGTLMFNFKDMVIHVDPVSRYADYDSMPKADIILITHEHGDHFDTSSINKISTEKTALVVTETCAGETGEGIILKNGDSKIVKGLKIEAVPAYNIVHMRKKDVPYHPKGIGNGYVITFADKKVYVAGDTENVPEMADLKDIHIAFLPMNLPYTMTPEMVASAARVIKPKILYPYHFGSTDTSELVELLKKDKEIEIRIRKLE